MGGVKSGEGREDVHCPGDGERDGLLKFSLERTRVFRWLPERRQASMARVAMCGEDLL